MTIYDLIKELSFFRSVRKWEPYHTPKSLAMSIAIEAAELMECYQWTDEHGRAVPSSSKNCNPRDEIADVFIYLLNFCDVMGIDPIEAAWDKIKKNAEKYPVQAEARTDT